MARFDSGPCYMTPGASAVLEALGVLPFRLLTRHLSGDWGDLDAHDRAANERALLDGSRLLSAYQLEAGHRIWIITEAQDDNGRRSHTTILTPEEY